MTDRLKPVGSLKKQIWAVVIAASLIATAGFNHELSKQTGYVPPIALWNAKPIPVCPIGSNFFC
jgi:hypothetical protein